MLEVEQFDLHQQVDHSLDIAELNLGGAGEHAIEGIEGGQ